MNTKEIVGKESVYDPVTDTVRLRDVVCTIEEMISDEPGAEEILDALLGVSE